jgi:hypothetical protein
VWVGHVHTKRRQKARARPPGGPVESRNSHARRAESDRTKEKNNTNTTPHTHAYTTSRTRVYTSNPTAHPHNNNRANQTHTQTHTVSEPREPIRGPPMKESNVGPQQTASTESVRSVKSVECWISSSVVGGSECGSVTNILREDKKHARARRVAQSNREIPTHVEPRVIEQKERQTPTQHRK